MSQAKVIQQGSNLDYVPSSDTLAGTIVVQGELVGVVNTDVSADSKGSISVDGCYSIVKTSEAITAGARVYWDADGNPVGGVAGSGASSPTATDNTYCGVAIEDAASTDTTVKVRLGHGVA